ncbi:metallophosphoesterase [Myroides marinus]|uniref:metallophosphoesterase n=1 Tax=Myroides marinus TaxID=703342 RepID=UPI0025789921|nr:metallophosphoesterase [Myroides marinus]MDM1379518.1 metallophosphoesterase [Myroides marinus]MDM1386789.1 metallophosphoesterase [Myroides marinus]MDM1394002.1 metallophosphoesterase [Myroides marinus]
MKLFSDIPLKLSKIPVILSISTVGVLFSCATLEPQYKIGKGEKVEVVHNENGSIAHTYYLIGNVSQANNKEEKAHFKAFDNIIKQASTKESTLVFLGDNTKKGVSKETSKKRVKEEKALERQLQLVKNNKGNTVFINGESDWDGGYEGVKRLEKLLVEKTGDKKILLPRKVCGLERLKINEETVLLVIDSQWYLENWDDHSNINEDCDIKTREDFFEEVRGEINKNQNKVVLLAMHHPVYSNGNHGGKFSVNDHLFPFGGSVPLPVIGSIYNYTRSMSGFNNQDLQSKKYNELNKRIRTTAQMYNNVIIVSAHEHNMQYVEREGVKQVISGAMSNLSPARAIVKGDFSAGQYGYTTVEVMKDKSVKLSFYGYDGEKYDKLYSNTILDSFADQENAVAVENKVNSAEVEASVYPKEWTEKTGWYKFLWGQHYRDVYGTPITASVADLTTLKGGLTPTISGGGNQSMSLRMVDKDGKEYVMRGVRKSVNRFVQTAVFKDQYVMNSFENTWAERFIYDFYTTSHPYTPFIIGGLSDRIGLYHTNPELFYVPKQTALGRFNDKYGDELYMIEERPSAGYEDEVSFGNAKEIVSTTDLIAKLRKDEKYEVDQKAFMRARIFDMLIGDWDRHGDQWRWSEFIEGDKVIYRPVPRDRDQAFAKIDGALLSLIKKLPPLRHMQNYTEEFANPRWINKTAFPLDQYLLKGTSLEDWLTEARDIVAQLDDEALDETFSKLPKEVQGKEVDDIKRIFKARRSKIEEFLPKYYKQLREYVILSGTDKKDLFNIERLSGGDVLLKQYRIKKDNSEVLVFEKTYKANETKELWLYGLNDEDSFKVAGDEKAKIKVRLIGGKNQDSFLIDNPSKVIVYDYADKTNEVTAGSSKVRTVLSNKYDINNFNYENVPLNVNMLLPNVGYNPEDGVKLGLHYSSTRSKFIQDPYTAKHVVNAFYSFNTKGFEGEYKGFFPNATNNWMFTIGGRATSPNFAVNYYGLGNETHYFDEEKGDEYKRVRVESYSVTPGYRYEGKQGGSFEANVEYNALKVQDKEGRFITDNPESVNARVFDVQHYGGLKLEYHYEQYNYPANPTVGFGFTSKLGWKMNLKETEQNFPYLDLKANFVHFIDRGERLVFATNFTYQTRLNDNYDFYHAATIGGNANLRGFRPERFTGKTSFVQTTDLRFNAGQFTAGFIPMSYGFYGGFDYGRVWQPGESSNKWHNSYGAGLWVNAIEQATLHCSYFSSADGGRFVFGLGFGF